MRLLPVWTLTLVLAAQLLTAGPAAAQMSREDIELRNQLYELQQQVQVLQQQMGRQGGGGSYRSGPPAGYAQPSPGGTNDAVAQLLARVQTLEEEVRTLRGRIEETQNALQRQVADLGKRIDDLTFRMQNPQAGGAASEEAPPGGPGPGPGAPQQSGQTLSPPPGVLGGGAPPPVQPAAPVKRTAELALQDGNAALARRDYPAAEAAAREVLSKFRTSPRAYDAQYLLAQSLAGQRQFAQAAIAFDDTYNRNRKGSRAPEALIGLASSLTVIGEKRAACDTLTKLHAEFPQQRQDIRDVAAAVHQRAGCK